MIKDLERDRLILDGRGANVFEVPLNKWTRFMASAEKVAGIYVPPECGLLCSGRDLKDFFYQFSGHAGAHGSELPERDPLSSVRAGSG